MKTPKTLTEAIDVLYEELKKQDRTYNSIKKGTTSLVEFHHTTGQMLRNEWGLWSGSDLRNYFFDLGLFHADDMTRIIFSGVEAKVKEEEFNIEDRVKFYQDFWTKQGINTKDEIQKLKQ